MPTPYITPTVLQNAPTGIAWNTIPVPNTPLAQVTAELNNICNRVTDTVDGIVNMALRATIDVETHVGPDYRLTVENSGVGHLLAARWPILEIVSAQVSAASSFPAAWTTIPANQIEAYPPALGQNGTIAPGGAGAGPSTFRIAPGWVGWDSGRNGYRFQVTYVNGWPHCGTTGALAVGATSIPVDDTTGWTGVTGTFQDGTNTESVLVTATSTQSGPGTLTIASPGLAYTHVAGTIFSSLPWSVQWACIALAVDEMRLRGVDAVFIPSPNGGVQMVPSRSSLMQTVKQQLAPFKRVL